MKNAGIHSPPHSQTMLPDGADTKLTSIIAAIAVAVIVALPLIMA